LSSGRSKEAEARGAGAGGEDVGPATRKRPVPRWVRRQSMEVAGMQMGGGGRRGRKAWAHAQRGGERGEKEEKETLGRNKEKKIS